VTSFKVPTAEELAHDFLWRIHAAVPAKGDIGIFNRSHYEQVLIVRVHNLEPEAPLAESLPRDRRLERNAHRRRRHDPQVLPRDRQGHAAPALPGPRRRPTKSWKFKPGDVAERKFWDDYTAAFEEMLTETSTDFAPWYLIPSNRNWLRNLAISEIVADAIDELNPEYPAASPPASWARRSSDARTSRAARNRAGSPYFGRNNHDPRPAGLDPIDGPLQSASACLFWAREREWPPPASETSEVALRLRPWSRISFAS